MKTVFINLIKATKPGVVCEQVCKKYLDLIKHVLGYIMLNSPFISFSSFCVRPTYNIFLFE